MLFRDHPLLRYLGIRSWPPVWTWFDGSEKNKYPLGEVGVLEKILPSDVEPADRCFLFVDYDHASYVGCLLTDNCAFCAQTVKLFRRCYKRKIVEIGSIDISHLYQNVLKISSRDS
jgi:hypothetical protein